MFEDVGRVFVQVDLVAHHDDERRLRSLDEVAEFLPRAVLLRAVARDRAEQQVGHRRRRWQRAERATRARHEAARAHDPVAVAQVRLQAGDQCDRRAELDRAELGAFELEQADAFDAQPVARRIVGHLDPDPRRGVVGVPDDRPQLQPPRASAPRPWSAIAFSRRAGAAEPRADRRRGSPVLSFDVTGELDRARGALLDLAVLEEPRGFASTVGVLALDLRRDAAAPRRCRPGWSRRRT